MDRRRECRCSNSKRTPPSTLASVDAASTAREFLGRYPEMTKAQIAAHFTDDAVYVNIPWPGETIGGTAIGEALDGPHKARFARYESTVRHVAATGDEVFAERTERFTRHDGTAFEVPAVSVFEIRGDRFCAWRDYFEGTHWQG